MPWMSALPHDLTNGHGDLSPIAAVCHRTYGGWSGDYAVGKGARGPIGFHFLVGKEAGQWVQFTSTDEVCYHAKGANGWSVGVEVTGTNEDPFTDWQVAACAQIVAWLHETHGIPLDYVDAGRAGPRAGFVAHNAVAGSDHGDRWGANWDRIVAATGGVDVTPEEHSLLWETWQRTKNLEGWAGGQPAETWQRVKNLEGWAGWVEATLKAIDERTAAGGPGGSIDVDALADAVAEKLAERLKD